MTFGCLLAPAVAWGHASKFPTTVSVGETPDGMTLLVETTFGLLLSRDAGASFHWICEEAPEVSGAFDPAIAVTPAGTFLITTFDSLQVSRDSGCSWERVDHADLNERWAYDVHLAADGAVWTGASGVPPNQILVSRDDAVSFERGGPETTDVNWRSIRTAPSDAMRVYASGVRSTPATPDGGGFMSAPVMFRSPDGGQSWMDLGFGLEGEPPGMGRPGQLLLLGVSSTDPDLLFAHYEVLNDDETNLSVLLRSADGGESWTQVHSVVYTPLDDDWALVGFFAAPDDAYFWVGSPTSRAIESSDGGMTWTARADTSPHMGCVYQEPDGTFLSCGANWAPDFGALRRSSDGTTWTSIVRFVDMKGPIDCPAGSETQRICEPLWPAVAQQFGIDTPVVDAAPDAGAGGGGGGGGGCGCGVALGVGLVGLFPRRRRRRSS